MNIWDEIIKAGELQKLSFMQGFELGGMEPPVYHSQQKSLTGGFRLPAES